jgi:putative ABC transport system permease protein
MPLTEVRTMNQVVDESVAQPRFRARLVGAFALLALTLASVGVFGVLAFSVAQRTREFGIRMALGAQSTDVLRLVMRDALRITAAGIVAGLAGAMALTRFLSSLLFTVGPRDTATFLTAALVLTVTALAACSVPALRAAGVDPAIALRDE